MPLDVNQIKYEQIIVEHVTIDPCKNIIQKCIKHIIKENLLLLKDLLEP